MISTIEIQPHIVAHTIARHMKAKFKLKNKDNTDVTFQQLHEYIRWMLIANEDKEIYDCQAPGNSY